MDGQALMKLLLAARNLYLAGLGITMLIWAVGTLGLVFLMFASALP